MNLEIIKKYFVPRTILDIGANVGQFHKECKRVFPESYIFSIEATDECEPYLKTFTNNYSISLLSREKNIYDFYTTTKNKISTGNSIYKELTTFFDDSSTVVVQKLGIPLDELVPNFVFDLIKLDTQGSELDILHGGVNLLSNTKAILIEVSLEQYNAGSPLKNEVNLFLETHGFTSVEKIEDIFHPINGNLIQETLLYLRK